MVSAKEILRKVMADSVKARGFQLRTKDVSGEKHLFGAARDANGVITASLHSQCKKVEWKITSIMAADFEFKKEDEARMRCAEIGRKVCGTCVSTLYATPTD